MNFIVAVTKNYAIGRKNQLLFHLPSDLKYFKEKTTGKVVIMGDRTYLSLPKRPLPNRTNIVLTLDKNFKANGAIVVFNLKELFEKIKQFQPDDVFVCGGASIYNQLAKYCHKAYITKIDKVVEDADAFVTNIEELSNWKKISSTESKTENGLDFRFEVFENTHVEEFKE